MVERKKYFGLQEIVQAAKLALWEVKEWWDGGAVEVGSADLTIKRHGSSLLIA